MKDTYKAVIGLEIHAELATKSKMFCSCANESLAPANTNACPICMAFPGTLPVPNKKAIELTIKVGKALHCTVGDESKFDRKNYFYPDLPKGYQISQYDLPLTVDGYLEVEGTKVRIRRVHLEEDTGKNVHKEGEAASLVDYNRAGVPLIELVTEPDITSAKMASGFARELQHILRSQGASRADMEKGQMRVEANISVRKAGSKEFGTKVEVKNLNSFRSVEQAIAYEVERHITALEKGQKLVQETRGWDEDAVETFSQRTKEEAEDYRYFPEPDIPPLAVADWAVETAELPEERLRRYTERLKLADRNAIILRDNFGLAKLFEATKDNTQMPPALSANWIVNEGIPANTDPKVLGELLDKIDAGEITAPTAKEAIKKAKETGKLEIPSGTAISDKKALEIVVDEVIKINDSATADVKAGKEQALGFLVGQVMAKTKGQADPKTVNELLKKKLEV